MATVTLAAQGGVQGGVLLVGSDSDYQGERRQGNHFCRLTRKNGDNPRP